MQEVPLCYYLHEQVRPEHDGDNIRFPLAMGNIVIPYTTECWNALMLMAGKGATEDDLTKLAAETNGLLQLPVILYYVQRFVQMGMISVSAG